MANADLPPEGKMFPNRIVEDQDMELEPVVMGPPAFGSPDPKTLENTLLPLADNPHATSETHQPDQSAVEKAQGENYNAMDKADLKALAEERELEVEGNKKADYVAALNAADAEDMNSKDFKEQIASANSMEELEAAEQLYLDSGQEYKSVDAALEKKREELENDDNENDNQ